MQAPAGWDSIDTSVDDDFEDETEVVDELADNDWVTEDGNTFHEVYEDGRRIRLMLDATDMTDEQAGKAASRIMHKEGFFPNVWFLSDHGNLHPFTFSNNE